VFRNKKNSLVKMTLLLASAILLKYFLIVNVVFAKTANQTSTQDESAATQALKTTWTYKPPPQAFCKPVSLSSSENTKILLALRQRHAELDARATELDHKQVVVTAAQHLLSEQLAALKQVQIKLEALEEKRNRKTNLRLVKLAKTYQAMQPRDAGRIFDQLNAKLVVNLLHHMDVRHSAAILAVMAPAKAKLATETLAHVVPFSKLASG
jgi:flagellar motility protein MotE (MotC chaperone)